MREMARFSCDGFRRLWRAPHGLSVMEVANATCISVKSRQKCAACLAELLLQRIDGRRWQ